MKALLVALNAKYIHSNLAVHSLKAYADRHLNANGLEIEAAEYTINQPIQKILADIYEKAADVLFFSCYIWNRREIWRLAADLHKISPGTDIWLGGPEASFDVEETMEAMAGVKGILQGEGEESFAQVVKAYAGEGDLHEMLEAIPGIVFRGEKGVIKRAGVTAPLPMDSVPFPYDELGDFENRILYYESSRGCPFRCSYCLSSIDKSLRLRSLEKVEEELDFFLMHKVPQVKLIDRTFNCDHRRALHIWKYLREHDNGITNFHFEIAGDLLTAEEIDCLGSMRPGQVQLEIGVQTTNSRTLSEISRPMDFKRLSETVQTLMEKGNVHLHLDLIAGLPYEDLTSFRASFDAVFALKPHQLQLGFLKVLRGSPMREKAAEYGLQYTDAPPYEVLETRWLSYDDLLKLKGVEEMVEVYYNSGQFQRSITVLSSVFDSAFAFFDCLAEWHRKQGSQMLSLSRNQRYENLLRFGLELGVDTVFLKDALIYDYYARDNVKSRPDFFGSETVEKRFAKDFYSVEAREHRYLKGQQYEDTADPRVLRKLTHLEKIGGKIYLFDYTQRDPIHHNAKVTVVAGASA